MVVDEGAMPAKDRLGPAEQGCPPSQGPRERGHWPALDPTRWTRNRRSGAPAPPT